MIARSIDTQDTKRFGEPGSGSPGILRSRIPGLTPPGSPVLRGNRILFRNAPLLLSNLILILHHM